MIICIYNNQLTSVTIPNLGVPFNDVIRSGTFGRNKLTSVTIPNTIEEIEAYAFTENELTSVTIPNDNLHI